MTSPFVDHPNSNPAEGASPVPQRKKLQLKPRSTAGSTGGASQQQPRQSSLSSKGNPFGAAKPREEILQQRGLDVSVQDSKFERKAAVRTYSVQQASELEVIREQLSKVTADLRHANEHELPEEVYREQETAKRQQLNDLVEKFDQMNANDKNTSTTTDTSSSSHYISRRHNADHSEKYNISSSSMDNKYDKQEGTWGRQQHNNHQHHHREEKTEDNEAYSSFFSNRRRHREEEQHA